jgi:hypothetical protein
MSDIRTLKLALLADTKDFIEGLDKADKETRSFSNKLDDALKVGAAAFLAVGAAAATMAVKIGIDAVKAAVEDQKAQLSLAQTLRNTVKATDAQIKATEDYIDTTARASGVADDQLRPSLDRLLRSTSDLTKAQKLQQLALDIAAGTGKDLATVTEALGKAYDGNLGALKRIGVPLDENIIKTKNFDAATKALSETFAGQADIAANSFAGRMSRIKISIDEAKETLGTALLPILEKFATFATDVLVPALEDFVAGLTGADPKSVKNALRDAKGRVIEFNDGLDKTIGSQGSGAYGLGIAVKDLAQQFGFFNDELTGANGETGLKKFIENMTSLLEIINAIIEPFRKLVEFSQQFAATQEANNMANKAAAAPYQKNIVDRVIDSVVVNISGAIDPQGVARTVTKVLGTASKTSGLKVPASATRVGLR